MSHVKHPMQEQLKRPLPLVHLHPQLLQRPHLPSMLEPLQFLPVERRHRHITNSSKLAQYLTQLEAIHNPCRCLIRIQLHPIQRTHQCLLPSTHTLRTLHQPVRKHYLNCQDINFIELLNTLFHLFRCIFRLQPISSAAHGVSSTTAILSTTPATSTAIN